MKKNQTKAYLFALLSVLCWSTVATAFKIALKIFSPAGLLLSAVTVSLIFLSIFLVLSKEGKPDLSPSALWRSAVLGFLNPFLYYLVLFEAYSLLPAQEALTLNYTWAVAVVLLSVPILGQKIRVIDITGLFISFFGVIIIVTKGKITSLEFSNSLGIILALASSLIWAAFWLFNLKDKRRELTKLFMNFAFGFLYILIYVIATGELFQFIHAINIESALGGIYVGLFEMGITFVFWMKAMQYSETTAGVASLIYLSPFLSLIFIALILGEAIYLSSIAGLAFIIGGIFFRQMKRP